MACILARKEGFLEEEDAWRAGWRQRSSPWQGKGIEEERGPRRFSLGLSQRGELKVGHGGWGSPLRWKGAEAEVERLGGGW